MSVILHIDSSARKGLSGVDRHGSHTRRLTQHLIDAWRIAEPDAEIIRRDVAITPPSHATEAMIAAAFTPAERRTPAMIDALAESEALVDEIERADVIVIGTPMYNFGVPSTLKAWIDNVVRVGRTFGFDRTREGNPYWPMLPEGKRAVIISARGDGGYDEGGPLGELNLVERSLTIPLHYIGISNVSLIAVEWDEFNDDRVIRSLRQAEEQIDMLVDSWAPSAVV